MLDRVEFRWLCQPAWCTLRVALCSQERLQPDRSPVMPAEPQGSEIFVNNRCRHDCANESAPSASLLPGGASR